MGKYFPASARHAKAREFLKLRQGTMTVLEYVARFIELARFGDDYVATDAAKVRKFEDGLKLSVRGKIVGLNLQDMDSMVSTVLIIEREIDDARSGIQVPVIRSGGAKFLLQARERSKGLMFHEGPRDRTGHPKRGGTSGLLANQDRGRVSSATSLDTINGIAPKDKDPKVMGHSSLNHQWGKRGHNLFLHTLVRARGTNISMYVRHKHLLPLRQAREARLWVEVRDRAHGPGLWGPRGVSTPWNHRLSIQFSQICGVRFYTCNCFLIHRVHYCICVMGLGLEVEASRRACVWKVSPRI